MRTKVTVKKPPKRAGATPLFRPRAAQKVIGVTPACFVQIMTNINRVYGRATRTAGYKSRSGSRLGTVAIELFFVFLRHKYLSKRGID
jgi:hypothetical protein